MKAKKFCIIALVLAIALLIAPISESKAEEELDVKTSGDYEYIVLGDETACITKYNGEDEEVIIPEELNGIKVTGIGYRAFSWKDNLKEITIPDSVENIGINPFIACFYLSNINISVDHPTLEFIDNALIYKPEKRLVSYLGASEESKYEIPDGIESIGDLAFNSCINLTEIKIPESVQSIGNEAFSQCVNLTEINIPESAQSIGDRAFMFCEKLTEVNVPDGVQAIGNDAFRECKNIKEINLPDSLQSIGNYAFARCVNIKEIKIPDSIKNIGSNPFFYCTSLLNIEISDNHPTLEFIDNALIYKPEQKLISYLSTRKESKYEIPNGIKIIGEVAFYYCENLTEVKIPESVQSIGDSAFSQCYNLTEINIPDGVQSIGDLVFYGCTSLTKIKIPESVQSIGESAFSQCYNLTEINIPDSLENIGIDTFYGCSSLSNINISDNHPTFEFIDNALIYKPEKKLVIYLSTSKERKYEIPEGTKIIGDLAFMFCDNLTEIKIPDGVQSIGINAFYCCENLKKIKIPASVKYIGEEAFYGSNNLTIIVEKGSFAQEYCKKNKIKYKIK